MIREIVDESELKEYEVFKNQLIKVIEIEETCNIKIIIYTNYLYDYHYNYKNDKLLSVIKHKRGDKEK